MTNIAMAIMENGPFIDGLPIKESDFHWFSRVFCMFTIWIYFVNYD